jgi:hypothetical protein
MNMNQHPRGPDAGGASDGLDAFRALVIADLSLQAELCQPGDDEEFVALVVAAARARGFALDGQAVRAASRPGMIGMEGLFPTAVPETGPPPAGWLPIRASWRDEIDVHWSLFGSEPLRGPFFEGDIRRSLRRPFNSLFRAVTPISTLAEWTARHPGPRPSGFIFHMSRCGSTLVSQMLAALDHNIVVSEAGPIDAVVQAPLVRPDLTEEIQTQWLASMVGALGHRRTGRERHYFVKLDSWHTRALPLFRRAFPEVPWIFMYRDPVEVMVSQLRMPGVQMIPGALGPDVVAVGAPSQPQSREDYIARVLARICEPVVRHHGEGGGLVVDYRELPEALWTKILPHFGVACSEADRAVMMAAARYDAKTPSLKFAPDAEEKQGAATERTRAAAEAQLGDLHRRLDALRLSAVRQA